MVALHIAALLKAIRIFRTQRALAQAIGASRKAINNWLNCGIRIPYEYALAIEIVTYGKVTAAELAPHIQFKRNGKPILLQFMIRESNQDSER